MNPLTPLELLDILEQKHGFESPALREALERAKKVDKLIQNIIDDEGTPVWLKVYINNFIEEKLK